MNGPDFSDVFNDNAEDTAARAMIYVSEGITNLVASGSLDTSTWPDGRHKLGFVAREGTAVGTETLYEIPVVFSNHGVSCMLLAPGSGGFVGQGERRSFGQAHLPQRFHQAVQIVFVPY